MLVGRWTKESTISIAEAESIPSPFLLNTFTDLKPTINYNNKFEYIPILTANIYADLLIIFVTFSGILYSRKNIINKWYEKYRLSAMIADILIGVLYLLLARYITYQFKLNFDLFTFTLFAVFIQIILDFTFYLFFSIIPKGNNHMLDFFKKYAKEVGINALLGDSILVVVGVIISAFLNEKSFDYNIVMLILSIYIAPYLIYMKD